MKRSVKINFEVNTKIKVGDSIRIFDGSSLSRKDDNRRSYYIVNSYPAIIGTNDDLNEIIGSVVETNITDQIHISNFDWGYLQDIVIKLGDSEFRTSSRMVKIV